MTDQVQDVGIRSYPVTIQALPATDVPDDSGAPNDVDGWTTLARVVFMARHDFGGAERFRSEQVSSAISTVWQMPYQTDMDPDAVDVPKLRRLLYRGRVYGITEARILGEHEAIELTTLAATKV